MSGEIEKGDVFAVAKVAGIMAAKRTSEIIPMCHPLNLSHVEINFYPIEKESRIDIEAKVKIKAQTGVEMEGFVAVSDSRSDDLRYVQGHRSRHGDFEYPSGHEKRRQKRNVFSSELKL